MSEEKALVEKPKLLLPSKLSEFDRAFVTAALTLKLQGCSWDDMPGELQKRGFVTDKGTPFERSNLIKRIRPYYLMVQDEELFETLKNLTLMTAIEATQQSHDALAEGTVPKQSLAVWAGIFNDKAARYVALSKPVEKEPENPLLAMLGKIAQDGGTLKLEVTPTRVIEAEVVREGE